MAFTCDKCGFKNSEVKVGGAISDHGTRLILTGKGKIDLCRDVLKVAINLLY